MKNKWLYFFLFFLFFKPFSFLKAQDKQDKENKPLTFSFLLERGELRYPDVKRRIHALAGAQAQVKDVFYRRLPDLNFTFNFNYLPYVYKQNRGSGSSYYFDEVFSKSWSPFINPTLNVTVPIYTFGKIYHGEKAAKAQVEMKKAEVEEAIGSVRFNIKKLYWGFLYTQSLIKYVLDITLPQYEELLQDQEKDFKEGKVTRASFEKNNITYYDLKKNQAEVQFNFAEVSQWIKLLGDLSENSLIRLEHERLFPLNIKIQSYAYYLNLFKNHDPSLKKSRFAYEARSQQYEYQKATFYPDIFFAGRLNYVYHQFSDELDIRPGYGLKETIFGSTGVSFGVVFGLRWNLSLWKGFNQQKKYQTSYLADLEQIKMAETFFEAELKKSYENLIRKEKILKATEEQFKAARRWTIFAMNAHKAKTGSLSDAQNGLITLFHKKKDYYTAIYQFNLGVAEFEKQLGLELVNYSSLPLGELDD